MSPQYGVLRKERVRPPGKRLGQRSGEREAQAGDRRIRQSCAQSSHLPRVRYQRNLKMLKVARGLNVLHNFDNVAGSAPCGGRGTSTNRSATGIVSTSVPAASCAVLGHTDRPFTVAAFDPSPSSDTAHLARHAQSFRASPGIRSSPPVPGRASACHPTYPSRTRGGR